LFLYLDGYLSELAALPISAMMVPWLWKKSCKEKRTKNLNMTDPWMRKVMFRRRQGVGDIKVKIGYFLSLGLPRCDLDGDLNPTIAPGNIHNFHVVGMGLPPIRMRR
jgi:hypothetical protein